MVAPRLRTRLLLQGLESRVAPATFNVLNALDSGAGSLREAVLAANSNPGADAIEFDPIYFSVPRTITLTSNSLTISDTVSITGTSAANCIVSGNYARRVFAVSGPTLMPVSLSKITVTAGTVNTSSGGGLSFSVQAVTVTDCTFTQCASGTSSSYRGGAIAQTGTGSGLLVVRNSAFRENVSYSGGAISVQSATLTISGCSITGNLAGGYGGGIYTTSATATIEQTTISGNRAVDGGGILASGYPQATLLLRNSTVSTNTAASRGGGIKAGLNSSTAVDVRIVNSTVCANSANTGGGIASYGSPASVLLEGSVVCENFAATTGTAEFSINTVVSRASGVSSKSGASTFVDLGGTLTGVAFLLGPLGDNGGPTKTHAPLAGSPLIDAGNNLLDLSFDQRGNPRSYGKTDIGAVEYLPLGKPYAFGSFPTMSSSTPTIPLTVTYVGPSSIQVSCLGTGDIRVTGPGGFFASGTLVGVNNPTDGSPRIATYSVSGPGGSWDWTDNGTYQVFVEGNQVLDVLGTPIPFSQLGGFELTAPLVAVVTNTNDSGPGSLRQAVIDSNANPLPDTITFSLPFPATITLKSTLTITDGVTVIGPGPDKVTVSGGDSVRPITIDLPGSDRVDLSDFTISRGLASDGGAIFVGGDTLTLTGMVFDSNRSTASGGAVSATGPLTVTRCTFRNNLAGSLLPGAPANGGAISLAANATLTAVESLFQANKADAGGGAIFVATNSNGLNIAGSTLVGNSSRDGGAIWAAGASLALTNCTIVENSATGLGGAIGSVNASGVVVTHCTIVENSATTGGGMGSTVASIGSGTITNSIFGNTAITGPDIFAPNMYMTVRGSMIGSPNGFAGPNPGSLGYGVPPLLAPLASNGGPTPTRKPLPGSPTINRGLGSSLPTFDQRGPGFARVVGSAPDIGAVEVDAITNVPTAFSPGNADVTTTGGMLQTVRVTYRDNVAIDESYLGHDILVTGPGGFSVNAEFLSVDLPGSGASRTVTYQFPPPGGTWDALDNGVYTLTTYPNAVANTAGVFVPNGVVGTFRVSLGTTLLVTNVADDGPGSLRAALRMADANSPATDTITFDLAGGATIGLTSGELAIAESVAIQGPGRDRLYISGGGSMRHFGLYPPIAPQRLTLSGLTLANGQSSNYGGSVYVGGWDLIANGLTFQNNTASQLGGSLFASGGNGISISDCDFLQSRAGAEGGGAFLSATSVTVSDSLFQNNSAGSSGGGGASIYSNTTLQIKRSAFRTNTASGSGGGLTSRGLNQLLIGNVFEGNSASSAAGASISTTSGSSTTSSAVVDACTFLANKATNTYGSGGGLSLSLWGNELVRLQNCTLTANSAPQGGGINVNSYSSTVTLNIQNSTIFGNSSSAQATGGYGGGGISTYSASLVALSLENTVVSGNTGYSPDIYSIKSVSYKTSAVGVAGVSTFTNLGGNLPFGTPLLLLTANNNGGLTPTMRPLPGSPLIDAGGYIPYITTDQRGRPRPVNVYPDIGAYEVQPPARVTAVVVNDGQAQRSRVSSIRVAFDSPVTLPNPNSAFQLFRQGDNAPVTLSTSLDATFINATLTFTGGAVEGQPGALSLADGRYTLQIVASSFAGDGFDGNGNGVAGDDYVLTGTPSNGLFRLFGDSNGDGTVGTADFTAFRLAFFTADPTFDRDGNGVVDSSDFLAFRLRFLWSI